MARKTNSGISIPFLADMSEFDKSIKTIDNKVKSLNPTIKTLKESLKIDPDTSKFSQAQDLIKQKYEALTEKANAFRSKIQEVNNLNAEAAKSKRLEQYAKDIQNTEEKLLNFKKAIEETSKAQQSGDNAAKLEELNKKLETTEQKYKALVKDKAAFAASDAESAKIAQIKELNERLTFAETNITKVNKEYSDLNKLRLDNMSKDIELTAAKADLLRERLDMKFDKNVVAELQKTAQTELDQTSAKLKAVIDGMKELERQGFDSNSQEFKKLQNEAIKLENDVKNAYVSLKEIEMMKFDRVASGLQSAGDNLAGFGSKLTMGVTTPLLAAGAAAYKFTTDLNEGLANVASLNIAGDRLQEIKNGVQEIAVEVGKNTDDIVAGAYNIISAYGDTADTMKMVEINAKAAKAGLATTNDAINLTSAVTKGYNDVSAEATQKAADLAFQTLVLGQTSFPDLASSIGKVVPASNALKISQEELFAVFATGTGVTGNASEISTQYGAVLTALMKPSKEMTAQLKEMGYSSGFAAVEALGFKGTLDALVESVNGSEEELVKLVGRKEAVTLMFALTGSSADDYARKLESLTNAAGAMDRAFEAQTQGVNAAGFSFEQSMIRMQVAAQNMGDTAAPIIEKAADAVEGLTAWLAGLDEEERKNVLTMGIALATFGPLVTIIGKITSGVGDLIQSFITLAVKTAAQSAVQTVQIATTEGATVAQIKLNTAMSANPIGAVVTILSVLIAGLASYAIAANLAKEKTYDYNKELENLNKSYNDNIERIKKTVDEQYAEVDILEDLIKQYDELNEEVKNNQDDTETLSKKKAELYDVVKKLQEKLPGVIFEINNETGAYKNQTVALEELAAAKKKALDADIQYEEAKAAKLALNKLNEDVDLDELKKQHAVAFQEYNEAVEKKKNAGFFDGGFGDFVDFEKKKKAYESLDKALREYYRQAVEYENIYNAYVNESIPVDPEKPKGQEDPDPVSESPRNKPYIDSMVENFYKNPSLETAQRALINTPFATDEQSKQLDELYKRQVALMENAAQKEITSAEGNAEKIKAIQGKLANDKFELERTYRGWNSTEAITAETNLLKTIENLNKEKSTKKEETEEEKRVKEYNARKKTLDLEYKAGEINSNVEYYNQLKGIRDEYLTENTDEWLQSQTELNKLLDDIRGQGLKDYNEKKQRLELEYSLLDEEERDKEAHYNTLLDLQQTYLAKGSDEYLKAQKELNSLKKELDRENIENYNKAVSDMKFESSFRVTVDGLDGMDAVAEYKKQADEIAEYRERFLTEGTKEFKESQMEEIALREKHKEGVKASYASDIADLDKKLSEGILSWEEYYRRIAELRENYERGYKDKPEDNPVDLSDLGTHADANVYKARRAETDTKFNDYDYQQDPTGETTRTERLGQYIQDLKDIYAEMGEYFDTNKEEGKQLYLEIVNATAEFGERTMTSLTNDLTAQLEEGAIKFSEFKDLILAEAEELYGLESDAYKKIFDMVKKTGEDIYKENVSAYNKKKRELDWQRKEELMSEEEYFRDSLQLIKDYLAEGTEEFDSAMRSHISEQNAYTKRIADEMEKAAEQARKAREEAEKSERSRLEKERQEKVDALAKEKEAELKAAQDAAKRASEAATAAEKKKLDEEKSILNERIKNIDAEIKKIRELSSARSEQEAMDKLKKQLAVAEVEYKNAKLDVHGDDFDIENKRLEVERLRQELTKAEQIAAENAIVKALEAEKAVLQEQIRAIEDSASSIKDDLKAAASGMTEDIRQIALEWAESQVPPVTEEEIKNAVIAALEESGIFAGAPESGGGSSGYDISDTSTYSSVLPGVSVSGARMLERVAQSLGYSLQDYLKMENAKAEAGRAAEAGKSVVNNYDMTINGGNKTTQELKGMITDALTDFKRTEFN